VNHFAFPSRVATVATLPSALLVSDFVRSVPVGCSRFSRCCHLIVDLDFHPYDRNRARPLTQSPELGALGFCFFLPKKILTYAAAGIATWWLFRNGS
jgi:hypothetical protein